MFNLFRLITARRGARDERYGRPRRGPLASMLSCDMNNLDRLTRALAEHRV